jgi:hypothetical protein
MKIVLTLVVVLMNMAKFIRRSSPVSMTLDSSGDLHEEGIDMTTTDTTRSEFTTSQIDSIRDLYTFYSYPTGKGKRAVPGRYYAISMYDTMVRLEDGTYNFVAVTPILEHSNSPVENSLVNSHAINGSTMVDIETVVEKHPRLIRFLLG